MHIIVPFGRCTSERIGKERYSHHTAERTGNCIASSFLSAYKDSPRLPETSSELSGCPRV